MSNGARTLPISDSFQAFLDNMWPGDALSDAMSMRLCAYVSDSAWVADRFDRMMLEIKQGRVEQQTKILDQIAQASAQLARPSRQLHISQPRQQQ
jgi:hypothetical protein